jgi:hypothetical protein
MGGVRVAFSGRAQGAHITERPSQVVLSRRVRCRAGGHAERKGNPGGGLQNTEHAKGVPNTECKPVKKKMTKATYICRSAKKKVVTYLIFIFIFIFIVFF